MTKKQTLMIRWVVLGPNYQFGTLFDDYRVERVEVRSREVWARWKKRWDRNEIRPAVAGFYTDPQSADSGCLLYKALLEKGYPV